MSRLANIPITLPKGVSVVVQPDAVELKGPKKSVRLNKDPNIQILVEENTIKISPDFDPLTQHKKSRLLKLKRRLNVLAGTTWANLNNAILGVSDGFKLKLELVGVGYRVALQAHKLNLSLGFSHPVVYELPKEVAAEVPSQTEIVLSSHDNQLLGQVAAEIRSFRPPECYKGKGIKFAGEKIVLKETKKK